MPKETLSDRHRKNDSRLRWPETLALVVGAISLLVLFAGRYLAPLGHEGVSFCAVSVLFLIPGFLLWAWFLRDAFPGLSSVAMWSVLSISIFSLAGTPFLILQTPPGYYVAFCALTVIGFLVAAGVKLLIPDRDRQLPERDEEDSSRASLWLIAPFVVIAGVLAYLSWFTLPLIYNDQWVYFSWVNGFADSARLAFTEPYFGERIGASRARFNGWLLLQAAFSRTTGIEPVELLIRYMKPSLVIVALLSVYTFARSVTRNSNAGLFAACVFGLFMLYYIQSPVLSFGAEFFGRLIEDKYAARYIFLPTALALAVGFVRYRQMPYAIMFGLVCWASVTIHPVGIAVIGLSMAGFAVAHVLANLRDRRSYTAMIALAASASTVLVVPLLYVVSSGNSLASVLEDADINSGDPDVLANMVFVRPQWHRILEFPDGSFIMDPFLLVTPAILVALVVGIPFLLWRVRDPRDGVGAQLLVGTLILVTVISYVPPIATFMGNHVVVPGQLWRLSWPLFPAALVTLGWLGWTAVSKLLSLGSLSRSGRWIAPAVCTSLLMLLAGIYYPKISEGMEKITTPKEIGPLLPDPFDPAYGWIRENVDRPTVFLAPDAENTAIPAYSSDAEVVSRRGYLVLGVFQELEERVPGRIDIPPGTYEVRYFFHSAGIDPKKVEIIRENDVGYLMLYSEWPMVEVLNRTPGFERLDVPSRRYAIYRVDPDEVRPSG